MRFTIRPNTITPSHTNLTVFIDGGCCGELVMRNEEYVEFCRTVERGCVHRVPAHEFKIDRRGCVNVSA